MYDKKKDKNIFATLPMDLVNRFAYLIVFQPKEYRQKDKNAFGYK